MGQGQLLAAGTAALIALAPGLLAQGPLYRERWGDLHLELLREQVLRASRGRDRATLAEVAELLAAPDDGVPFVPAARALALLRGQPPDAAFVFRATVGSFVLPEVVDPAGDHESCRRLHVSLFLPFLVPAAGKVRFEVAVDDSAGAQVFATVVEEDVAVDDLRMARARAEVPAERLPDGRYRLTVRTFLDGAPPRAGDPVLRHGFHVLRGYQQRAQSARTSAEELSLRLPPVPRALLLGLQQEVNRAFAGEAFDGESDAVLDLRRLEQAIDNVTADRAVLDGIAGPVPTALPIGDQALLAAVLPRPAAATRRPLIVCAAAVPAYDLQARRPGAPSVRSGRWLQRRLADLRLEDHGHVVYLQSPAAGLAFAKGLPTALAALQELLPTDGRTVLVLELESAVACSMAPSMLREQATAVVLVGAGMLAAPALRELGELRILGVPLTGHPGSQGLQLTAELAGGRRGAVDWQCEFELAPELPRPWTFGAAAAGPEIRAFLGKVLL